MSKITFNKRRLLKLGRINGNIESFFSYLRSNNLENEKDGILFEYAVAFILGVYCGEVDTWFPVIIDDELDMKEKIDFSIMGNGIQLKLNWKESFIAWDKEEMSRNKKYLLTFTSKTDGFETSGIDIMKEIFTVCGMAEHRIEAFDNCRAADVAEELLSGWLFK